MHHEQLDNWRHPHVFGQIKNVQENNARSSSLALTLAMMGWEILAGIFYGSMALLADGLTWAHMLLHCIAAFAYAYAVRNADNRQFSLGPEGQRPGWLCRRYSCWGICGPYGNWKALADCSIRLRSVSQRRDFVAVIGLCRTVFCGYWELMTMITA